MNVYLSKTLDVNKINGIHLFQDHLGTSYPSPWDDYGYIVKFNVWHVDEEKTHKIGHIRLLIKDQKNTADYLCKTCKETEQKIFNISAALDPSNAVSLPVEIDFYKKLHKISKEVDPSIILEALCDASYFYANIKYYKTWEGFSGSIMREGSSAEALLRKGCQIAMGIYSPQKTFTIELNSQTDWLEPAEFFFDNQKNVGKTNINILTGRNGVGKSFLLKKLVEAVTGLLPQDVAWPFFHKLIVVAYSPFEEFYIKDELAKKLDEKYLGKRQKKISTRKRLNVNEYAYLGFRTEKNEFDLNWPKKNSVNSLINIIKFDLENNWWREKGRLDILKQTLLISIDFEYLAVKELGTGNFIKIIDSDSETLDRLEKTADRESGIHFMKGERDLSLSSGQKMYSYIIPAITSEIENESLLILDEPELYLHPTLEVGLINMMKHLLGETSSHAIIATHSAIITREVERKAVNILRKDGSHTIISKPSIETYGESLEQIVGEVFDDYITVKPFQKAIDTYLELSSKSEASTFKISNQIGDEGLAYLIEKTDNDNSIKIENK